MYPVEDPPAAEVNWSRVRSNATLIWYPPSTAAVVPLGPWPVTEVRSTFIVTCTVPPTGTLAGLGDAVIVAVPLMGAPWPRSADGESMSAAAKRTKTAAAERRGRVRAAGSRPAACATSEGKSDFRRGSSAG